MSGKNRYVYNSLNHQLAVIDSEEYECPSDDACCYLLERGFLSKGCVEEERAAVGRIMEKRIRETEELSCWIFTTDDCNLRCPYCFEKDSMSPLTNTYMEKTICEQTVHWLLQQASAKNVNQISLSFTGGEPLLNLSAIEYIVGGLENKGLHVESNMITNGVLLDTDMVKRLSALGIRTFQITLDGPPQIHDKRRILPDGSGTFSIIFQNIINALRIDSTLEFIIRINVDEDNGAYVKRLIRMMKRMELDHFVAICMNDMVQDNFGMQHSRIIELLTYAKQQQFRIVYGELNNCWMMSDCWYMVNADGSLYKCPSLVGMDTYKVGHVDGTVYQDAYWRQVAMRPWQDCLDCELVGLCGGGCPYRRLLKHGSMNGQKSCRKQYLQDLIRLRYEDV